MWVKGQSGNPKGRASAGAKFARVIRSRTNDGQALLEFALEVMEGKHGAELSDRIDALKWLADRGWGKAVETVVLEDESQREVQPDAIATEQLEAVAGGPEGQLN
jgi:hypothetical protein